MRGCRLCFRASLIRPCWRSHALFVPLMVFLLMPWVRPRKLIPLALTYVFPMIPILIWWDGFALDNYRLLSDGDSVFVDHA